MAKIRGVSWYSGRISRECWVKLVLETSLREYTTTHNSADVLRMIREVGCSAVKGMIDTATLGFSGETMEEAVHDLEGHLAHVHVADGVPNGHLILEREILISRRCSGCWSRQSMMGL